jgi:acyl carrier protein
MDPDQRARLVAVCVEQLGVEPAELTEDLDFFEDLNLDRSDLADLLVMLEDALGTSLEDGIRGVRTFGDLETLVEDALSA